MQSLNHSAFILFSYFCILGQYFFLTWHWISLTFPATVPGYTATIIYGHSLCAAPMALSLLTWLSEESFGSINQTWVTLLLTHREEDSGLPVVCKALRKPAVAGPCLTPPTTFPFPLSTPPYWLSSHPAWNRLCLALTVPSTRNAVSLDLPGAPLFLSSGLC